jgi:tetratricopeptide (TPR) repeat protein
LAAAPTSALDGIQRQSLRSALDEFKAGVLVNNDRSFAWLTLGNLYENLRDDRRAIEAYRNAIRVEPNTAGPRTNLAALFDRLAEGEEQRAQQAAYQGSRDGAMPWLERAAEHRAQADALREEELPFLARDAAAAPETAAVQYRYGLALYLHGDLKQAEKALRTAVELEPQTPEFTLGLALLYQKLERWNEALDYARRLQELRPDDPSYRQLVREIQQQRTQNQAGPTVGPTPP